MRAPGSYTGLTTKQAELLSFLRERDAAGATPSFDEMADAMGLVKSGIARLITGLEERGYIQRIKNRSRAITVFETPQPKARPISRFSVGELLDELGRRGLKVVTA